MFETSWWIRGSLIESQCNGVVTTTLEAKNLGFSPLLHQQTKDIDDSLKTPASEDRWRSFKHRSCHCLLSRLLTLNFVLKLIVDKTDWQELRYGAGYNTTEFESTSASEKWCSVCCDMICSLELLSVRYTQRNSHPRHLRNMLMPAKWFFNITLHDENSHQRASIEPNRAIAIIGVLLLYYTLNVIVVMHGTVSKREVRRDQLNNASQGFVTVKAWALNRWKAKNNTKHAGNTIFMLLWGSSHNMHGIQFSCYFED